MRLFLFDDADARSWEPFALTRPISELLFGALTLGRRTERALGVQAEGVIDTGGLLGFEEPGAPGDPRGAPPVVEPGEVSHEGLRVFISSRVVLPLPGEAGESGSLRDRVPPSGGRLTVRGETVGWALPSGIPAQQPESFLVPGAPAGLPDSEIKLDGYLLADPWALMADNAERVSRDLGLLYGEEGSRFTEASRVEVLGDFPVTVGTGVRIDPWVVLDAREGPIHLERGVHIHSFTRLHGPAFVGPGSTLLGGVFSEISCGPVSRLRGEVEGSIILGYSNKAHDGYLGHAVVGRWVNLGAFTTNSDLKNTYGSVRVPVAGGERDTGLMKVGVFLGDHVKTGIGTLLNTGTVVGAGSNLFGGAMPPRRVPPFSWGVGSELTVFRREVFLQVAERAMGRRGVELGSGMRGFLEAAWEMGVSSQALAGPGEGSAFGTDSGTVAG